MQLCSENHDEIVYDGSSCPACNIYFARDAVSQELADVQRELEDAQNEISELADDLNAARERIDELTSDSESRED